MSDWKVKGHSNASGICGVLRSSRKGESVGMGSPLPGYSTKNEQKGPHLRTGSVWIASRNSSAAVVRMERASESGRREIR